MRKLTLISVLSAGVALGGCATTTTAPVAVSGAAADVVAQVQQTTQSVCSFLPTAAFVASILAAGNPIVMTVESVASSICKAASSPAARRGHRATVNGIPLEGHFVRH